MNISFNFQLNMDKIPEETYETSSSCALNITHSEVSTSSPADMMPKMSRQLTQDHKAEPKQTSDSVANNSLLPILNVGLPPDILFAQSSHSSAKKTGSASKPATLTGTGDFPNECEHNQSMYDSKINLNQIDSDSNPDKEGGLDDDEEDDDGKNWEDKEDESDESEVVKVPKGTLDEIFKRLDRLEKRV